MTTRRNILFNKNCFQTARPHRPDRITASNMHNFIRHARRIESKTICDRNCFITTIEAHTTRIAFDNTRIRHRT